jgi:uncharacterized protein (DUF433 family)
MLTAQQEEMMTAGEIALLADVPVRYVHQVIEDDIIPNTFYVLGHRRGFVASVASLVAFDKVISKVLTVHARREASHSLARYLERETEQVMVRDHRNSTHDFLDMGRVRIDLSDIFESVSERMSDLKEANERVVRDERILSGTPVLRGTRIPVYDVAASVNKGISQERIKEAYSSLSDRDIELARIWAQANPPIGRPRKAFDPEAAAPGSVRHVPRRRIAG